MALRGLILTWANDFYFDNTKVDGVIYGDSLLVSHGDVAGNDVVYAQQNDDTVFGDAYAVQGQTDEDGGGTAIGGNDMIDGGIGNDALYGDSYFMSSHAVGGSDVLRQGKGSGVLFGDGYDLVDSTGGNDALYGRGTLLGEGYYMTTSSGGNDVLDARAQTSELALRASQSALMHQGARGYLMSAAPQRRIRESHFVAIVTPAIKHLRWEMARLSREVLPADTRAGGRA